ncbi:unnamed protein product [Colletotrichum noveboracense]|uniref:Uncharacterized protein n=1 Tax=Colletotrichum noveboracense TaxID=2664923 RepID=A0A9W4WGU8_9PEZI|nr:unnamed protein product [Colletotrichum noveboracense]
MVTPALIKKGVHFRIPGHSMYQRLDTGMYDFPHLQRPHWQIRPNLVLSPRRVELSNIFHRPTVAGLYESSSDANRVLDQGF